MAGHQKAVDEGRARNRSRIVRDEEDEEARRPTVDEGEEGSHTRSAAGKEDGKASRVAEGEVEIQDTPLESRREISLLEGWQFISPVAGEQSSLVYWNSEAPTATTKKGEEDPPPQWDQNQEQRGGRKTKTLKTRVMKMQRDGSRRPGGGRSPDAASLRATPGCDTWKPSDKTLA
jgi:hypothetical protein